ncbi:putative NOL1/NOP2/sun domain protein [Eremomyces bilateralis CBS 781.70]|uniref:NOL1/NOP2/sun domain protein n=1 Tax=Eremomyces bilateralis CBS 781.70 TaxID=1392243 RepID=A0A6G1G0C4_9PEZI|nr:putative NOL1/NOP2/sun domain protein [Eremomyces bilateralis CBS 781.70]KAF1811493.1 putative NOL1/NOP2/sun domain protein [Eremomyces bilateralis CBS 781.70]
MSLYYEAADILSASLSGKGSIQSLVYSNKTLKNKPGHLFALLSEASKWSPVLKDIINQSGVLAIEKKLTPTLALLLCHDLLLSKSGIAAPSAHPLRLSISRHKARLSAELTKIRIKRGYGSLDELKASIESLSSEGNKRIRWVRVNTLKISLDDLSATLLHGYKHTTSLQEISDASSDDKLYYVDAHIPNLLALPSTANLLKSTAYAQGQIILQDKASCFPAVLMGVRPGETIVDACAAPGNKTTQLAASCGDSSARVIAFEKDKLRALTLRKMVERAGAQHIVSINGGQDFLACDPESDQLRTVTGLLLDPSCSGSGIIGRDDIATVELPGSPTAVDQTHIAPSRKRKRGPSKDTASIPSQIQIQDSPDASLVEAEPIMADDLKSRLQGLAKFQLEIIKHAMSFPAATKITYSTCSIHATENEEVVFGALASGIARERGWRIWTREEQVSGIATWPRRGSQEAVEASIKAHQGYDQDPIELAEACIRCCKGTDEGTMGFFLVGFLRDGGESPEEEQDEWNGFSDDEV